MKRTTRPRKRSINLQQSEALSAGNSKHLDLSEWSGQVAYERVFGYDVVVTRPCHPTEHSVK